LASEEASLAGPFSGLDGVILLIQVLHFNFIVFFFFQLQVNKKDHGRNGARQQAEMIMERKKCAGWIDILI
jgi:hypothetical protein